MAGVQFKNKVLILGLVAGVLAVAYALGLVFSPTNVQRRRSEVLLLPAFKKEAVKRIQVTSAEGGTIEVLQGDKGWSVQIGGSPFPASEERVGWFLDSIAGLRRSRLVSSSPESWKSFEVTDEARTRIRLSDASGHSLVSLIVGKGEEGARGNYARLEGSNEVVLLNKSLATYTEGSLSYWSHMKFFPDGLDGSGVMRISVRASLSFSDGSGRKVLYTLIRRADGGRKWQVVEPAAQKDTPLNDQEIDRMASTLAGFEGNEFVPGNPASGLESPSAEILFSTEDNKDYRILVGSRSGRDQYFAKVDGGAYVYLVPEWRVRQVTRPLEELKETAK
jgi:predicted secreted protein